ncbi:hypothetical protein JXB41_03995 [Candidatus Woesearchaeota archaeon]|nr:hypothetical protein [Candidatus Woesearchaeota archaeon]
MNKKIIPILILVCLLVLSSCNQGTVEEGIGGKPLLSTVRQQPEKEIPISKWIDIPVEKYQQNLNSVLKVSYDRRQAIEAEEQKNESELDSLQESEQKINNIFNKDKAEYIDIDANGMIDYSEFNARTAEISKAVYNIRHQSYEGKKSELKKKGLLKIQNTFNANEGLQSPTGNAHVVAPTKKAGEENNLHASDNKFIIIAEGGIYDYILDSLTQYEADIEESSEYSCQVYLCNDCTHLEIKQELIDNEEELGGVVFIGDIPSAWFEVDCGGTNPDLFPSDLYFMDLDGNWGGICEETPCNGSFEKPFKEHSGEKYPEIFMGRLTSPDEANETKLIRNYFDKNHRYRTGENSLPLRSLVYVDDNWADSNTWSNEVAFAYTNQTVELDRETTTAPDFMSRWDDKFEHVLLGAHSGYESHGFFNFGEFNSSVNWYDVRDNKPKFHFYNLFSCSALRFSEPNHIGGWYAFQESDYGLAVIGSTKTGAMSSFLYFYEPLSKSYNFGLSFREWFNNHENSLSQCEFYGLTLIGDPTLELRNSDEDLFVDSKDNCPYVDNPSQIESEITEYSLSTFSVIEHSKIDIGAIQNIFDKNLNSIARSAGINPFNITLDFGAPVPFRKFRGHFGNPTKWEIMAGDDLNNMNLIISQDEIIPNEWVELILPETSEFRFIEFIVYRTEGDNFVHINEIEVFSSLNEPDPEGKDGFGDSCDNCPFDYNPEQECDECTSQFDTENQYDSFCIDTFDNDCDGLIDCDDEDCVSHPYCVHNYYFPIIMN